MLLQVWLHVGALEKEMPEKELKKNKQDFNQDLKVDTRIQRLFTVFPIVNILFLQNTQHNKRCTATRYIVSTLYMHVFHDYSPFHFT